MSKKLFVGNLPFDVNDADLATVLAVAGKVVEAKVIINNKTGRSKGYGFVELETEELALDAVKKFEGATLNERPLTVQLATPKQEADAKNDGEKTEGAADGAPAKKPAGMFTVKSSSPASEAAPITASDEAALAASAPNESSAQAQVAAAATDATSEQGA
jgi:RNA recognition motif-containing protein